MSVQTNKIKGRIKSVTGAYKVTSAMKLVSTVKLKKSRNLMITSNSFFSHFEETLNLLLSYSHKVHSPFFKINEKTNKKLFVIVSSTLGLCGAYNANIFKIVDKELSPNDDAIILGKKAYSKYSGGEFKIVEEYSNNKEEVTLKNVNSLANYILKEYEKGTYSEVIIIHSEYKNFLVFLAKSTSILPLNMENIVENDGYEPIFEPDKQSLINSLVPLYIKGVIYSKLLESEVCEQASRNNAMENATNNATDLLDELNLEFNKARQASITQEITEIVAASKAM